CCFFSRKKTYEFPIKLFRKKTKIEVDGSCFKWKVFKNGFNVKLLIGGENNGLGTAIQTVYCYAVGDNFVINKNLFGYFTGFGLSGNGLKLLGKIIDMIKRLNVYALGTLPNQGFVVIQSL